MSEPQRVVTRAYQTIQPRGEGVERQGPREKPGGRTVRSASPWNTMVGTVGPLPLGRIVPPPPMAAKADGMSLAAPQASPEWTPTAAKISG